ncbi:Predicted arabinose efflux permease, MFS family [Clostridium acidisoli DSM 12555]|jgi:predicted MFS family arabinose efflux permease|uniref:Predicted arabinose efflux permease, MFS family n=1 Tax=Clostridium acidisoli DSM 12555 TaxID=1121291 RepID=A0A1W1WYE8_9CLOT|nr:MFS transporter [Clostridium acidisoli]SMC16637.1 Predicted arabinose efflux permease, MFS family [Clostridium acidisoli DSM 12555]
MSGKDLNLKSKNNMKLWNINFISLLGINVLTFMAFYLVYPILSKYAINLGASLSMAGVIVGLFSITALIIGPFGGILTDKTNKKYVMEIGTLINGIATLGYSLAPNIGVIIFFRILHGASFSITSATSVAWATEFIPKDRIGEGIGYLGISQIIATAFGPEIGIEGANRFGISKTFMVAAVLIIVASFCMNFLPNTNNTPKKNTETKKHTIKLKEIIAFEILPLSFIGGLFFMGNGLVTSFLVLMGDKRNIRGVGIYFIVNALFLIFTRPISGKIYDKKGLSMVLYPALLFSIAEALFLGHANALWMIILAAIFKAFGQGFAQPALQAECFNKMGSEKRGLASSTFFIGANVGQGVGPLIGGGIASSLGYTWLFNISALMLLCGILFYAIYKRKKDI